MSRSRTCKTQDQAAAALGVSRRSLIDWLHRGCPGDEGDGYDIERIKAWRMANIRPVASSPTIHDCQMSGCWVTGRPMRCDEGFEQDEYELRAVRALAKYAMEHLRDRVAASLPAKHMTKPRERFTAVFDQNMEDSLDLFYQLVMYTRSGDISVVEEILQGKRHSIETCGPHLTMDAVIADLKEAD